MKHAKRVTRISIAVGELMQLDTKILRSGIEMLLTGPLLSGAKLRLYLVRAKFSCFKCGRAWTMKEARNQLLEVPDNLRVAEPDSMELPLHFLPHLYSTFLHCDKCGSSDITAVRGKDILLQKLTME